MAITINIYYHGKDGNALKFAQEMIDSGVVEEIRSRKGNLGYDYFLPLNDSETLLLIDSWQDEKALDDHHKSNAMKKIAALRDKYNLHMQTETFVKTNL